jgi:hypothetical protein
METKTHWKKVFDSDYLGSCDLEDGKDLRAVIKSVTVKEVKGTDGKAQERNVATFTDAKIKPMILNATNCKIVKKFAKSVFINDWNNIPVQIYVKDDIRAFGDVTEGLRIREIQPTAVKPKLTRNMPAWSNVVQYVRDGKPLSDIEKKYDISEVKDEILKEAV